MTFLGSLVNVCPYSTVMVSLLWLVGISTVSGPVQSSVVIQFITPWIVGFFLELFLFNFIEFHPCTCKLVFSQSVNGTTMQISGALFLHSFQLFVYPSCKFQLPWLYWTSGAYLLNSREHRLCLVFTSLCHGTKIVSRGNLRVV